MAHPTSVPAPHRRFRRRLTAAVLPLVLACGLVAATPPPGAGAWQAPPTTEGPDLPAVDRHTAEVIIADDPRVEADLGAVALDSPEYRAAVLAHEATRQRLVTAESTIETSIRELRQLDEASERLAGELIGAQRRRQKAEVRLRVVRADLADLAVGQYVAGGIGGPVEAILDLDAVNDLGRQRVFVDAVQEDRRRELHFLTRHLAEQVALESAAVEEADEVRNRIESTTARRDQATADRDQASVELVGRRQAVADTRLETDVVDLDFRFVNFNAYYRAARMIRAEQPECGIRWTAIAAIARTESWHGTYNGSEVDADGNLTKPIIGIALDGSNGTAVIGDTDGGELDGDTGTDRAVGPMQFIPSTWRAVERDGNGDGKADPQNLYDATLTAAAYLCRRGPGLETDEGLRRAFRSYNNDGAYVELVLSRAHAYDAYEVPPLGPGLASPSPAIVHAEPATTTPGTSAPEEPELGPPATEDEPTTTSSVPGDEPPPEG